MPRVTDDRGAPQTRPARASGRTPAKPPRGPGERPSRLRLLLRRQRRLLRPALWGLAGLAVVLAGAAALRSARPGGALAGWQDRVVRLVDLRVREVVVEGRANTPEPLLRAALGVSKGGPLLGFSIEDARERIEKLTWVQKATVERRLPGTVVVRLVERRPFAVWQTGGRFVLIDRAGQAVVEQDPVKDAAAFKTLPLVVGAGAPAAAADLLDRLAAHPALRGRVVAAVRVGERRWNLRLNTGGDVLLPEGGEGPAIARLAELHASHALLDRPLQVLDLRLPDRLVVRPQPEPQPAAGQRRPT